MSYIFNKEVTIGDGANLDAFSRLRVSDPLTLFNSQLTYNLNPLLFEQITSGTGASISHDSTNRCASISFSATPTGGQAYMQSFEYMPYQPGKSQLAFITFNFQSTQANTTKFAGLSDGTNGIELQQVGSTVQFVLYSGTTNGNQTALKANWNLDPLDGNGPSGYILDLTKVQILVIDFQALYAGRVRVGFDIDGSIIYVHEFLHSNDIIYPYIQTATLPIRCGMTCTNSSTTTMYFLCSSVISEGGATDANRFAYSFTQNASATAGSSTRTHMLSLRPKTTFNGFTNRIKTVLTNVDLIVTGNNPVYWELCLAQTLSGTTTFNDVNTTYSSIEYNTAAGVTGSPAIVINSGYVPGSAVVKSVAQDFSIDELYPISLNAAGAQRALGTLTLVVTGIGGNSACSAVLKWKEYR